MLKVWVGAMATSTVGGAVLSEDIAYFTLADRPAVTLGAANNITSSGATLHMSLDKNNGSAITDTGFYFGTSSTVSKMAKYSFADYGIYSVDEKEAKSMAVSGLQPNTKYYYRAYSENAIDETISDAGSFTTLAATSLSLSTSAVSMTWDSTAAKTVTVTCSGEFDCAVNYNLPSSVTDVYDYAWLNVQSSGKTITVSARRANYSASPRSVKITVTCGSESKTFTVTQAVCEEAAPTVEVSTFSSPTSNQIDLSSGVNLGALDDTVKYKLNQLAAETTNVRKLTVNFRKQNVQEDLGQITKYPDEDWDVTYCGIDTDAYTMDPGEYYVDIWASNSSTTNDYWAQKIQTTIYFTVAENHTHDYKYPGVEEEHPHKEYLLCECGYAYYTGEEQYVSSCVTCNPAGTETGNNHLKTDSSVKVVDTMYVYKDTDLGRTELVKPYYYLEASRNVEETVDVDTLKKIIDQFDVLNAHDSSASVFDSGYYYPAGSSTYCTTYARDVANAYGACFPSYVCEKCHLVKNSSSYMGERVLTYLTTKELVCAETCGGKSSSLMAFHVGSSASQNATNDSFCFMREYGEKYGWEHITSDKVAKAMDYANKGYLTIGLYSDYEKHAGHVFIVYPSDDTVMHQAQAGGTKAMSDGTYSWNGDSGANYRRRPDNAWIEYYVYRGFEDGVIEIEPDYKDKEEVKAYIVKYDTNGGSGAPEEVIVQAGEFVLVSDVEPTRGGYTFRGWATDANTVSAEYQPGDSVQITEGITFYAVWKKDASAGGSEEDYIFRLLSSSDTSVTVTFDNNTGESLFALIVVAVYDQDGRMLTCKTTENGLPIDNWEILTVNFLAGSGVSEVRAFLVGHDTYEPLCSCWIKNI